MTFYLLTPDLLSAHMWKKNTFYARIKYYGCIFLTTAIYFLGANLNLNRNRCTFVELSGSGLTLREEILQK